VAPPARNLRLVLEYDGTDFAGWQRQARDRTVQEVVETALARMLGAPVVLRGAGRTDAGVHARAQAANFRAASAIPCDGFRKGLNGTLPADVAVVSVDDVPEDFDARRWARGKHYCYRVWNRASRSPLHARTAWHLHRALDVEAMNAAAAVLLGEHDFSAFRAAGCDAKHPVRTLTRAAWREEEPGLLALHLEGTAFLRGMARVIAGTLVEVGLGARPADRMAELLAGRDRTRAGRTAPAHGLTLEAVRYDATLASPLR
jgi:tRNA pseudouridine38-40 synthase